ncbi:MAG: ElyC/SanA/YdcF family protein [Clostridiaceae bacterium]
MTANKKPSPNKKKRLIRALVALIILVVLLPLSMNYAVMATTESRVIAPEEAAKLDVDAILVLGARVWGNGQPSGILKDRINTGVDLFEAGASDRLLMSGDHGQDDYDEVNAMKDYAIERGVDPAVIFMDHAGFSTYESLYRARDIFQIKTVVIVSQQYHLYRALYIARALGLDAYGVSCDTREYNAYLLFDLRETLARCKDFLYSIFQPLPTYLGDVIPITGDGSTTNG